MEKDGWVVVTVKGGVLGRKILRLIGYKRKISRNQSGFVDEFRSTSIGGEAGITLDWNIQWLISSSKRRGGGTARTKKGV